MSKTDKAVVGCGLGCVLMWAVPIAIVAVVIIVVIATA